MFQKKTKQPKQPKMKKEKKEGGIISTLIVALTAACIIFAVLLNIEKNIMANYEKAVAVIAKDTIPEGTILDDNSIATYLTTMEMEKTMIPATAFTSVEELKNYVTANGIDKGSIVTSGLVYENTELNLATSKSAFISINANSIAQAVNGVLRSGDVIDIYTTKEDPETKKQVNFTKDIWQDVFVYAVYDTSGVAIENGNKSSIAQLITVLVPEDKVEEFYNDLTPETLHISKVSK